jgi:F-type H+-transporting ATPase subunit b
LGRTAFLDLGSDAKLESNVLSDRREKSSMMRHSKLPFFVGAIVVILALVASERRLMAQEAHKAAEPGHAVDANASGEAHGSTEATPDPMEAKPALAIFSLVVFVVLMFVLGRFAWKPLLQALHNREAHLEHVLLETERARNESESLLAEHRKVMQRAADEVRGILDKARQEAQSAADSIVKQAQAEADQARQRAQREIVTARDQALGEIWQTTADMAVSVAGRVLSKELSTADHRRLLDAAIQELPAQAKNGHGGTPV